MNRKSGAGPWMSAAFCAAVILTAIILAVMGPGVKGTIIALRVTARLSFLLFWLAYAGGAMAKLFGPTFDVLARHGRDFGLSFAAGQLVHVGLIVWLSHVSGEPLRVTNWFVMAECIGLAWLYVLALLSVERLRAVLSPKLWRLLYAIGFEYIAFIFFFNFVLIPVRTQTPQPIQIFSYLPFAILIVLGPVLRWSAMARSSRKKRKTVPM